MPSDLLRPLAVFARQPQSQRYIKAIRNLGDAWCRLADELLSESDTKSTLVKTNFDLVLTIENAQEAQSSLSNPMVVEMSTREPRAAPPEITTTSGSPPRHYRILADWGTDLI
ncbi:uncharacterized protein BO95DRAFT_447857 [Aspergillus brunneoviolaceus CBS 621.78]|uniref:Uncharacterized protein n=1 Tax=Aspergillus brunneoviolaceus CBS 621.78 TaxID=1450534 RepID=A0ACD1FTZ8_9EURO|nr:hypothetical protein BO95DRAFT_447857 [Aspergillus brunneoviolaceus CBS 621.78]RAH40442.1 hypothetical protein BO95DRAFT_447857 [Aspergillus brunneoviolaceus CBS 621.78]